MTKRTNSKNAVKDEIKNAQKPSTYTRGDIFKKTPDRVNPNNGPKVRSKKKGIV